MDAEVEVGPRLVVAPGLEGFISANQRPMDQGDIKRWRTISERTDRARGCE